jgi:hypothetical protein
MGIFRRLTGVDDAWSGVLADKKRVSDGQNMFYRLIVTLDDGSTKRVRARRGLWKSLEPGDRLVKRAGERYPTKSG